MNPNVNAFQRNFVNEVKRCDEMERKLRYLREQIHKEEETLAPGETLISVTTAPISPANAQMVTRGARYIFPPYLSHSLSHIHSLAVSRSCFKNPPPFPSLSSSSSLSYMFLFSFSSLTNDI